MNTIFNRKRITANLLSIGYLIVLSITLLGPVPKSSGSTITTTLISILLDFDFYTHLIIFLIWGFLASSWPFSAVKVYFPALATAALLEILQGVISNRVFELTDLIANVTGTLTGLYIGKTAIFNFKPTVNGLSSDNRSS